MSAMPVMPSMMDCIHMTTTLSARVQGFMVKTGLKML